MKIQYGQVTARVFGNEPGPRGVLALRTQHESSRVTQAWLNRIGTAVPPHDIHAEFIDFARSAILVLLEIIAPAMVTALVVGLGIGLLQAVTQIQEQTLVFVPKIVAIFLVLLIALPFAGQAMSGLMIDIASRIAAY